MVAKVVNAHGIQEHANCKQTMDNIGTSDLPGNHMSDGTKDGETGGI
jgi:hypothetical protein